MKSRVLTAVLFSLMVSATLAPAMARDGVPPYPVGDEMVHFFGDPLSLYFLPDGSGTHLSEAYAFGGALENGQIAVRLVDNLDFEPVPFYPAEDLWLHFDLGAHGTHQTCGGGDLHPEDASDIDGWVFFRGTARAGGWSTAGARVYIAGVPLESAGGGDMPVIDYRCNSADINGDLRITLSDIAAFTSDMFTYHYRSDFNFDGMITLSDITRMTQAMGMTCD